MKRIHSKDAVVLDYPVEQVRQVLLDVSSYNKWWPRAMNVRPIRVRPELVGSAAHISYMGSEFSVRILDYTNTRIVVEYYEGVQRGKGVWTLEDLGRQTTRLTYEVNLEPVGLFPSLLGRVLDYGKLHSSGMRDLYAGLAKYLDRPTPPGPGPASSGTDKSDKQ